jgi:hypothetical protein
VEGTVDTKAADPTSADLPSGLINELTPAATNMQTKIATVIDIPLLTMQFTVVKIDKAALSSPQGTKQVQGVPMLER